MAYSVIKPTPDVQGTLSNENDIVNFTFYDQGLQVNLGQSFFRINGYFTKTVNGSEVPVEYGDWMHINDLFTDSLWKRIKIEDTQNNITIESGQVPHIQSIAFSLVQPNENYIGGINSNSAVVSGIDAGQVAPIIPYRALDSDQWDVSAPLDFNLGFNLDDINSSQFVRWGETLEPFPLAHTDATAVNNFNINKSTLLNTIRNRAGITRLKRQFLYGWSSNSAATSPKNPTVVPYIYKPGFCDVFDGKKSYWTNRFRIELVRSNIWNSIQTQPVISGAPADYVASLKTIKFHINEMRLILFTFANVTKAPRQAIWVADQYLVPILSPFFMNREIVKGAYDCALISLVKNTSLVNAQVYNQCAYKSGLGLNIFNQESFKPENSLKRFYFNLDFGDSNKIRVPDNEQYEVWDNSSGTNKTDLLMLYMEFLRMCKINPFNPEGKRCKIDFMSYVSQLMYIPISLRKDRSYWQDQPNQTVSLGLVAEFDNPGIGVFDNSKYVWIINAFRRIIL